MGRGVYDRMTLTQGYDVRPSRVGGRSFLFKPCPKMSQTHVPKPCPKPSQSTESFHICGGTKEYTVYMSMTSLFICWTCHREVAIRVCIFCVYVVRVDVIVPTSQKGRAFGGEGFCFVPCLVQQGRPLCGRDMWQRLLTSSKMPLRQAVALFAGRCCMRPSMVVWCMFFMFFFPAQNCCLAVLHQDLTRKSGFMLLLEMILSNLVLEQVKLF